MAHEPQSAYNQGTWSLSEQMLFKQACITHGWGKWKNVATVVTSRNTEQIKSHAQKFVKHHLSEKLELENAHYNNDFNAAVKINHNGKINIEEKGPAKKSELKALSVPAAEPSDYDVLCGLGDAYGHYVGNRRFGVVVEMSVDKYWVGNEKRKLDIVNQMILWMRGCNPPGRFLSTVSGEWKVADAAYVRVFIEETFRSYVQMKTLQTKRAKDKQTSKTKSVSKAKTASKPSPARGKKTLVK